MQDYINHAPDKGSLKTQLGEIQNELTEIKNGWANANNENNEKIEEQLTSNLTDYLSELKNKCQP